MQRTRLEGLGSKPSKRDNEWKSNPQCYLWLGIGLLFLALIIGLVVFFNRFVLGSKRELEDLGQSQPQQPQDNYPIKLQEATTGHYLKKTYKVLLMFGGHARHSGIFGKLFSIL